MDYVVKEMPGGFVELAPGQLIHIGEGDELVRHPWQIVEVWSAEELEAIGIYRVAAVVLAPGLVLASYNFQRVAGEVVQVALSWTEAPPPAPRYCPVWLVRERLEAKGKWDAMIAAIVTYGGQALLAKILTLREGIAADDPDAAALFAAIGEEPAEMLAPEGGV